MNHHPLHTNAWFAEHETVQGKNVVVGNLVYSLALGMSVPDVSGSCIANLEVESLLHRSPTFHGDTIYAETRVLEVAPSKSKDDRGIVTVETKAFNQRGEEVCYFRRKLMVWKTAPRRRAAVPTATTSGTEARAPPARGAGASGRACSAGAATPPGPALAPHPRPWAILVSEVMLQQTQVDRVVPTTSASSPPSRRRPPAPRPGRPKWCDGGRGSATTGAASTCTGRPTTSSSGTADGCRRTMPRCGPSRRRPLHGAGGALVRLRPRRGGRRHQRRAGARPRRPPARA